MLKLEIPESNEHYDEASETFITYPAVTLELEHSLVSLAKWESKWETPFLNASSKTTEQTVDYLKCMVASEDVIDESFERLTQEHYEQVSNYIDAKMTATWFTEKDAPASREVITAEIIYYWMISLNIPFECQSWHINRLLTLVKVCNNKNAPADAKKSSRADIIARNKALNEQRKAQLGTTG